MRMILVPDAQNVRLTSGERYEADWDVGEPSTTSVKCDNSVVSRVIVIVIKQLIDFVTSAIYSSSIVQRGKLVKGRHNCRLHGEKRHCK